MCGDFTRIELNDDTRWILGRPCFVCAPVASILRMMGYEIARKAEDEQAVVIHWYLTMYAKHGTAWREKVKGVLQDAINKRKKELETEPEAGSPKNH